jgi:hypothetical protein
MAGSQHHNGPIPAQSTGAIVLGAADLSGGQLVAVDNDGPNLTVTTVDSLGEFFNTGSVITLDGDVIGAIGTNTVVSIGGQSVDLGGSLTTEGAVTFDGAFSWVGNLLGPTDVTFPESGTLATVGTLGAALLFGNPGSVAAVGQGITLGNNLSFNGDTLNAVGVIRAAGTNVSIAVNDGTSTISAGATLLPDTLASAHILVGNASGTAAAVALSGDAEISNTGAVTVIAIGGEAVSLAGPLTISGAYPVTLVAAGTTDITLPEAGTLATTATDWGYGNLPASAQVRYPQFPAIGSPTGGQSFLIVPGLAGTLLANGVRALPSSKTQTMALIPRRLGNCLSRRSPARAA